MSHPFFHSKSSVKKFGGTTEDYQKLHNWMDATKAFIPDCRHRLLLHNAFGIFLGEQVFGVVLKRASDGREVPVRPILEQHIIEDFGYIPTLEECFKDIKIKNWMFQRAAGLSKSLSKETHVKKQRKLNHA